MSESSVEGSLRPMQNDKTVVGYIVGTTDDWNKAAVDTIVLINTNASHRV